MQLLATGKDELFAPAADASMRTAQLAGALLGPFSAPDHESWKASAVREAVAVHVGAPETRGAYLKRYTSFLITLSPGTIVVDGVRRRYSDFAWLRAVLHARYAGLLVPSLPEKTAAASVAAMRGQETAGLLLGRARGLTLFLSAVLASPYLRSDAAVQSFLSVADDAQWETAKKETAVMDNAGAGHLRWLLRVLNAHIASSPDNAIAAFKRSVEQQEKAAAELAAAAKRLADRSAAAAKDVVSLHGAFLGWQSMSNQEEAEEEQDSAFRSLLGTSASVVGAWSQVAQFQPAVHELLLLESVRYLLHQAADLKDLLAEREQLLHAAEASPSAAGVATPSQGFSFGGVSFSSRGSSFSTTASQLASRLRGASDPLAVDVEAHRRRARHVGELMTRALVAEEMRRFRSDKTRALRELMGHLACAEAQMAKRSSSLWREFLKTTGADNETLVADTKQILDGAAAHYAPGGGDGAGIGGGESAEAY